MSDLPKIEYGELSPETQGFIRPDSPPGARMAAARGLLPLVTRDLATLLCYLLQDPDPRIARQAQRSLRDLPPSLLETTLASDVNPKVVAYFARQPLPEERLYDMILFNRATADETFELLAGRLESARLLDVIATNQQRMIRHPAIARALVGNRHTSASTAAMVREFYRLFTGSDDALREPTPPAAAAPPPPPTPPPAADEDLPEPAPDAAETQEARGEEAWEEFEGLPEEDQELPDVSIEDLEKESFEAEDAAALQFLIDPERELSSEERKTLAVRLRKMRVVDQMRIALKGNTEARMILIKSANKLIQECVMRNSRLTIEEVMKVARDKSMREEIVRMVTLSKDWTKNYIVRLNLTWNPKTPLTQALKYLNLLNEKDLAAIAKSKQVPGMLSVAARKMVQQKQKMK